VGAATVVVLAVCVAVPVVWFEQNRGPSVGELRARVVELRLPADFVVIGEQSTGNELCMEECTRLTRRYSSPLSIDATQRIVDQALTAAGYACIQFCAPSDRARGAYATWRRSPDTALIIDATVYSAKTRGNAMGDTIPLDPNRDTHIDFEVEI
jgi:hypothetical protein